MCVHTYTHVPVCTYVCIHMCKYVCMLVIVYAHYTYICHAIYICTDVFNTCTITVDCLLTTGAPAQVNLCLHNTHGRQNLCYVCHQREARNVPASMVKYRQQQEELERKMMDEHMKQSQALSLVLELKKRSEMKKYNQEVAAFNLAMAQQALVCTCMGEQMDRVQNRGMTLHGQKLSNFNKHIQGIVSCFEDFNQKMTSH